MKAYNKHLCELKLQKQTYFWRCVKVLIKKLAILVTDSHWGDTIDVSYQSHGY